MRDPTVPSSPTSVPQKESDSSPKTYLWIKTEEQKLSHRNLVLNYLIAIYIAVVAATFTAIFFQGFGTAGFKLDQVFLNWLGGATITEVAVVAGLIFRSVFGLETKQQGSRQPRLKSPSSTPQRSTANKRTTGSNKPN